MPPFPPRSRNHKAQRRHLAKRACRNRREKPRLFENGNMIQMLCEPSLQAAAYESRADRIVFHESAGQHHYAGKQSRETDSHLVEDDSREDQKENKDVEEGLRTLHGSEGGGVPAALGQHQILDGRKNVHENVGTEHGECQQEKSGPAHGGGISERFLNFSHCDILVEFFKQNAKVGIKNVNVNKVFCRTFA